ncbi:hypothetical protein DIPPA_34609 [Diplonema papillatum]|nr:hypothetical protein DIPPA_34609 [Diplonema papillatum]
MLTALTLGLLAAHVTGQAFAGALDLGDEGQVWQPPCTGAGGEFCQAVCCFFTNNTIAFCCPYDTTCCGTSLCCTKGETCTMDCTSDVRNCIVSVEQPSLATSSWSINALSVEGRTRRAQAAAAVAPVNPFSARLSSDTSCDLSTNECCEGTCCPACCGGTTCAPEGQVCCNPAATSKMEPDAYCPLEMPSCCLAADGSNTTCCSTGSSCCTDSSCPADSVCCGNCNCCNTKTQECNADGTCSHLSQGVGTPLLMFIWGLAFFTNLAFLIHRYDADLFLKNQQSAVCLECLHAAHCDPIPMCPFTEPNRSQDCVKCSAFCERTRCHGADVECELSYTAHVREVHQGEDGEQETVSFNVLHARCPCEGCHCKNCIPYFTCPCACCQCVSCKSTDRKLSYMYSALVGAAAFLTGLLLWIWYPSLHVGLVTITSGVWMAVSSFLWFHHRSRIAHGCNS